MITLYDAYTCADLDDVTGIGLPEQLQMQDVALQGLYQVGTPLCEFASELGGLLNVHDDAAVISPFVAEALYSMSKQYLWYIQETGKIDLLPAVDSLKDALRLVGQRWQVASTFHFQTQFRAWFLQGGS